VTSKQSLEELNYIYREIYETKQNEETSLASLPMILVGNKCDEDNQREVTADFAKEYCSKTLKGCGYIETSAKTGYNVHEAFQELLSMDKTRNMSLRMDLKKTRSQIRKEKLKGHCTVM
ncbi:GTP-binding protein Di-Ras2-like protein 1, partial [Sarcoptes scabiei]